MAAPEDTMDPRPGDSPLEAVLAARERRGALRLEMAAGGRTLVSLTLNIPGWPKSDESISQAFGLARSDLVRFLAARWVDLDPERRRLDTDAAGDFFLAAVAEPSPAPAKVKELAQAFEAGHLLGRLVDVDVTDPTGAPVSSGLAKPCLICRDAPAVVCMRRGTHTPAELRQVVDGLISSYLKACARMTPHGL